MSGWAQRDAEEKESEADEITQLRRELADVRLALIETGRLVGCGLSDEVSTTFLTCGVPAETKAVMDKLRRELAEAFHQEERVAQLETALRIIRGDLRLNMKCHHPPDDGSEDLCDGVDCILCENLHTIDAALSASERGEPSQKEVGHNPLAPVI